MLNYIWLALLFIGITTALYFDISDEIQNTYQNGAAIPAEITFDGTKISHDGNELPAKLNVSQADLNRIYSLKSKNNLSVEGKLKLNSEGIPVSFTVKDSEKMPQIWRTISAKDDEDSGLFLSIQSAENITPEKISAVIKTKEISFVSMKSVTNTAIDYAKTSVTIAFGLIGIMALWLGIMKIGEEAGMINVIAKAVKPVTKFLFPEVPPDHPAVGAMIMNMAANMLGLGNAATPFGLKAMEELDSLNPEKGTATNAMCTFLAINTAGLTLIPATAIAVRAAAGSSNPAVIIGTSIFGAFCATATGIISAKLFEKFSTGRGFLDLIRKINVRKMLLPFALFFVLILVITGMFMYFMNTGRTIDTGMLKVIINTVSVMAIPAIIFIFVGYGAYKKVNVYEKFIEGAKEGFNIAVKIIPYLVAMLVAIGIFRAGGGMKILTNILSPLTGLIGMPAEVMPMALMRPLSGSGSLGIMTDLISVHGPDSFIGILASTIFGSTETTFYVIAVYFGAVNIKKTRHALAAGLMADIAGVLGALFIVKLLFG